MESPACGLITYSLLILHGSTPVQPITICGGDPMFTLQNLFIHMFVLFLVVNSKACDFMCIVIYKNIFNFFH